MGSGGRPGITFRTKVLAKTETSLTISLTGDEAEYFTHVDYLAKFTPAPAGGDNGGEEHEGDS